VLRTYRIIQRRRLFRAADWPVGTASLEHAKPEPKPFSRAPDYIDNLASRNSNLDSDTLIIGGGAAGLAAAAELAKHGGSARILEARTRLGGRIFTRIEPGVPIPVEFGAEFIHGTSRITFEWLRQARTVAVDASEVRWELEDGQLRPTQELFEEMKKGLSRAPRPRKDLPFAEFLSGPAKRFLRPKVREFACMLVEGFDAADATRVSTLETIEEWSGGSAADAPTFRPLLGYQSLIDALLTAADPQLISIQTESVIEEIRWRRGSVQVMGRICGQPFSLSARNAIITLPLGVLQRAAHEPGAVRFAPELQAKRRPLELLGNGPVHKVLLRFRNAFWEQLDQGRYREAAFLHAPQAPFPTFWTSLPLRSPIVVAWTAGPNAQRFAGCTREQIIEAALTSFQSLFGKKVDVREELEGTLFHDWESDPFSCGAYSYVLAGGARARKTLAMHIANTLFFAGEASDVEGESGTVAGALHSGIRAARELLRSMRSARLR
jgi:monoamine oxidase